MPIDFRKHTHAAAAERRDQDVIVKAFAPKEREATEVEGVCTHLYRMDSGWGFATIVTSEKQSVSITGTLGGELYEGARVRVHGFWSQHATYGWQVKLRALEVLMSTSADGVIAWFSDRFPDVGPVRARSLLDTFGNDIWNVIEQDCPRLAEAPQIGDVLAERIHHTYVNYQHEREAYVYLAKIGLGPDAIRKAFNLWGRATRTRVEENPYNLQDLPGVGFKAADRVAKQAGLKPADPRRILAGFTYAMEVIERDGSTCATEAKICAVTAGKDVLDITTPTVRSHFARAVEEGGLIGEFGAFFRRRTANAEHRIAEQVGDLLRRL